MILPLAEAAEPSKTAFYLVGGALAVWAVILGALGLSRPSFPGKGGAYRVTIAISVVLVAGAIASAILTS